MHYSSSLYQRTFATLGLRTRTRLVRSHPSRHPRRAIHHITAQIEADSKALTTDTGPSTPSHYPPSVHALRQRAQSSSAVKQLLSGRRECVYTRRVMPKDLLLRAKSKRFPPHFAAPKGSGNAPLMVAVDELEPFPNSHGKSSYMLLSKPAIHGSAQDPEMTKFRLDTGMFRKDICEHATRILRLRIIQELQRIRTSSQNIDCSPVEIPEKGTCVPEMSRRDIIRIEVKRRLARQNRAWTRGTPFVGLDASGAVDEPSQLDVCLPPGGLQLIIEVPQLDEQGQERMARAHACGSVMSERAARSVWENLKSRLSDSSVHKQQHSVSLATEFVIPTCILDSSALWSSWAMDGRPEPSTAPVLSVGALESLYSLLPRMVPESEDVAVIVGKSKKAKKKARRHAKDAESQLQTDVSKVISDPAPKLIASIEYDYSFESPGVEYAKHAVDGRAVKRGVPVYGACEIFGKEIAQSVLPWLLGAASDRVYVGVVALPCTADLSAQFDRLARFAKSK